MVNKAVKCKYCQRQGTFVHENVGVVFECEGVQSQPTKCDLMRQRALFQKKRDSAIIEKIQARECDKAYFTWLINDHTTMINNITKMIQEMGFSEGVAQ